MSLRKFGFVLLTALIGGVMLKGLVTALESRFVFFPYKGEDQNPASLGIPYELIQVPTSDGERLAAWQLTPDDAVADVVYFHGNGGNLSVWLPVLAALYRMNLSVLAVDYRGYGLSTGSPSEAGLYLDAEATARFARDRRRRESRRPIVFWGRSLGGPVAAAATRAVAPDGLVLESSFADKASVAATQPVLRVLNMFAAYRFDTIDMLRGFAGPVLVIHGDGDSIVPFHLGQQLFKQVSGRKQFLTIPGADHNDFFDPANAAYWTPITEFIAGLERQQ